jgi:hypothetical protein
MLRSGIKDHNLQIPQRSMYTTLHQCTVKLGVNMATDTLVALTRDNYVLLKKILYHFLCTLYSVQYNTYISAYACKNTTPKWNLVKSAKNVLFK